MKTATIYTVIDRTHIGRSIMPGSGLVSLDGAPANSDMKIFYDEGNKFGAQNLRAYEDRIKNAAGRLFTRYPTSALIGLPSSDLHRYVREVGNIDENYKIVFSDPDAALAYGRLGDHVCRP